MTNPLHDAAMAAKRFHDAALAYLDRPEDARAKWLVGFEEKRLTMALEDMVYNPRAIAEWQTDANPPKA